MGLEGYRESDLECKRIENQVKLIISIPDKRDCVLEIEARDGFFKVTG